MRAMAPCLATYTTVYMRLALDLLYAPLTIPLVYCHNNSFQRATGLVRPSQGGEQRTAVWAHIMRNYEAMVPFPLTSATAWWSLIAGWCLMGAAPRSQPWTPTVTLPNVCDELSVCRCFVRSAGPRCVAQCTTN